MPRSRYPFDVENMEEEGDFGGEVSVVDVYDIASDIGKECEKIIDQYGADAVTSLMPKVINALELLENLATRNERENTQLHELRLKIAQLENDKLEKAEYRQKFEKELEAIEEQWRSETKELLSVVTRLQEENRRLAKDNSTSPHRQVPPLSPPPNGDMLQKLKDSVEKQRDEIRLKDNLLQEKCHDIENLKSQVERLNNTSRELRRKHKLFQSQVRTLCDERADFLVQLQDQQRDIVGLRQRLGLAQKENEDLAKCDPPVPVNKAVYDLDDPNRPRFTTQELKDILHERNELKARVSDLEDELETYRPKNKSESPVEEDAPVQGPLPYEPDDAPWKKCSESGIRKFFRKIFSESSSGSSFPRRSLSTLSKMALSATNEPVPV
ncbi:RILP-like protein homolog [Tribolium castaneum]|uniref:RILP-like protein homolog n=1 Tax=Tribolium castaneum TaxID=7070 RepID=A0A139WDU0_TRICA|nr:PREDICTED: RILP-like protein homolog [Tribolium castaneum]KYB26082.1 RILP-like protein homolog [Tribolium castaneum]|eukprot:XP_008196147.1 PREDICTED: RILP-like protein homolog [Tribolium castaneum]